jgi:tetraprenyl-beta-curcumene synthase
MWRTRALTIPDAEIRADALDAIVAKRNNTDGAALFWVIARRRNPDLLRLLVKYELMSDFLDSANERAATAGIANGQQLHLALTDALRPGAPVSNYYRFHPWCEDGGYLSTLVASCRDGCSLLPSFAQVRSLAVTAAELAQVQALNHEPEPTRRDEALREWSAAHEHDRLGLAWFELTAAGSAWLTVLALLALAAEPEVEHHTAKAVYDAYFPWLSVTAAMFDSYADLLDDTETGGHNYLSHYGAPEVAFARLSELLERAAAEVGALPRSQRHQLILCCMLAMYLSKDSALGPQMRVNTMELIAAGGSLARLLLPILRTWRIVYSLRSA